MLAGILDRGRLSKSDKETDLGRSCSNRRSQAERLERTLPEPLVMLSTQTDPGDLEPGAMPAHCPASVHPRAFPVQTVHHPGQNVPKGPNPQALFLPLPATAVPHLSHLKQRHCLAPTPAPRHSITGSNWSPLSLLPCLHHTLRIGPPTKKALPSLPAALPPPILFTNELPFLSFQNPCNTVLIPPVVAH